MQTCWDQSVRIYLLYLDDIMLFTNKSATFVNVKSATYVDVPNMKYFCNLEFNGACQFVIVHLAGHTTLFQV